jgi:hypothetical protein
LASLAGRKRGRPPGSRNKVGSNAPHWNETTTSKNTQLISTTVSHPVISMLYVMRTYFFAINIACGINDFYKVDC